jgi:hypothetical protein
MWHAFEETGTKKRHAKMPTRSSSCKSPRSVSGSSASRYSSQSPRINAAATLANKAVRPSGQPGTRAMWPRDMNMADPSEWRARAAQYVCKFENPVLTGQRNSIIPCRAWQECRIQISEAPQVMKTHQMSNQKPLPAPARHCSPSMYYLS